MLKDLWVGTQIVYIHIYLKTLPSHNIEYLLFHFQVNSWAPMPTPFPRATSETNSYKTWAGAQAPGWVRRASV